MSDVLSLFKSSHLLRKFTPFVPQEDEKETMDEMPIETGLGEGIEDETTDLLLERLNSEKANAASELADAAFSAKRAITPSLQDFIQKSKGNQIDLHNLKEKQEAQQQQAIEDNKNNLLFQTLQKSAKKKPFHIWDFSGMLTALKNKKHKEKKRNDHGLLIPVTSSNLDSVGYTPQDKELVVKFLNSGKYKYDRVSKHMHKHLMDAESKGKYFNRYIKDKKPYEKLALADLLSKKI